MINEVNVNVIKRLQQERRDINKIDIRKAKFIKDGEVVFVSKKDRDDFRLTGLSTIDFVELYNL